MEPSPPATAPAAPPRHPSPAPRPRGRPRAPSGRWILAAIASACAAVAAAWLAAGAPALAPGRPGAELGAGAGLEVEAQPRRFPVIGEVVAALGRPAAPRRAPLGLARFGWGGEEIAVARLQVPNALLDVPLVLTAEEDGWVLTTEQGVALADGIVGREAEGRDPDGGTIHVLVTELVARPGTEFLVRKRCCARAIAAARARGR